MSKPVLWYGGVHSISFHTEEEGSEGLASAYPHYCGWGDIDSIIDQSAMHGLDDHVQQFSDTQAAQVEDDQVSM